MKRFQPILFALLAIAPALPAQEPADSVFALADVETAPVATNIEELRAVLEATYPADKRAAGQGATVTVAFVLGTDGVPRGVAVTESTDAAFDSVTVAAMGMLRFSPATVGGRPVAVRLEVPVQWEPDAREAERAADARADSIASGGMQGVYELSGLEVLPRPTNINELREQMQRLYPAELRRAGVGATVQVRFIITEQGDVGPGRITSSTDARFDALTIQVLRMLKFHPGQVGGRAVPTWAELPILWTP